MRLKSSTTYTATVIKNVSLPKPMRNWKNPFCTGNKSHKGGGGSTLKSRVGKKSEKLVSPSLHDYHQKSYLILQYTKYCDHILFNIIHIQIEPVTVAKWIACVLTVREVSLSNSGILPLLHVCRVCDQLLCWPSRGQPVSYQRWISGIHCMQVTKHASQWSTLALNPRADITRSPKQGYCWPHKKDLCPPKFKTKKIHIEIYVGTDTFLRWQLGGKTLKETE